MAMRTGKKYWEGKPGFGLEGKAKMSKTVKTPYRGICNRLKGLNTLVAETRDESAQKKIEKI